MSIGISQPIVTNGLVFAYDMANTKKSFKGAPTTNYVTNATAMTGWNNYGSGTPVSFDTDFGTKGYGLYNAGSWNGIYRNVVIPSAGTYTFSAWVRYIGGSANNNGGGVYISGWGGGDSATVTSRTLPGQWQRLSITLACTNLSFTFYLISWGGTNGADYSSWEMTMPQAEAGSYATGFVDGTRTTSNNLVSLTGNATITTTSLVYNSDGTFSFNGGTDSLLISGLPASQNFTWSAWVNSSAVSGAQNIISMNGPYFMRITGSTVRFNVLTDIGSWLFQQGTTTLSNNTWYYLTMIYDQVAGLWKGYINGTQEFSVAKTGAINSGYATFYAYIGYTPQGGENAPFNGKIATIQYYNRALSSGEVLQNFNALRGRYGV